MQIIRTKKEFETWRSSRPVRSRVGFVPTMGALHEGHLTLLREARPNCDELVLSIFVNPTQFAPNEDFQQYPRPFEKDCLLAQSTGVDAIFAPTREEVYPSGHSTFITVKGVGEPLCGVFRPHFFAGVATVVYQLFHIVKPDCAWFGLKDAQQFLVIQKMVADLGLPVEVLGVPTVRESNGLAMSSRNEYLSPERRSQAASFYNVLCDVESELRQSKEIKSVLKSGIESLKRNGFDVQYLELREVPTLSELNEEVLHPGKKYLLASAVLLSGVRLIDNIWIN